MFPPLLIIGAGALAYAGLKKFRNLKTENKDENTAKNSVKGGINVIKKVFDVPARKSDNPFDDKKVVKRKFVSSGAAVALAAGGFLYSPLTLVSIFIISYNLIPHTYHAIKVLIKEHRACISQMDVISVLALLLTGHYFTAALTDLIFYSGSALVLKLKESTRKKLINAFGELPDYVWLLKNGVEVEMPLNRVKVGDIIVVNAGGVIPVDGIIVKGIALVDQHALTGESQALEKEAGERVFASGIVLSGRLCIKTDTNGNESTVAKISELLNNTADYKSLVQTKGEYIADKMVLPTLALSILAAPISGVRGALGILFSYFGDNVRIVAPVSSLNFLTIAAKNSILIKDGRVLELLNKVDTVVFDKTGTLTSDQPNVGKIYTFGDYEENELLKYVALAESKQTHPIARAIIEEASNRDIDFAQISDHAKFHVGYGVSIRFSDKLIRVGSPRFMDKEAITVSDNAKNIIDYAYKHGYSLVMIAINDQLQGAIEMHPCLRPEAETVVNELKQRNMSVYIISGDHEKPVKHLAKKLGITNWFAEVLPQDKANIIEKLQSQGKFVCFAGDGINDSIALKKAQVSVSLSGASAIATDTADIILTDKTLNQLNKLFELSEKSDKNLKMGFATSVIPGGITIFSVFFLHAGLTVSIVLYSLGFAGGIANSMLPLKMFGKEPDYEKVETEKTSKKVTDN